LGDQVLLAELEGGGRAAYRIDAEGRLSLLLGEGPMEDLGQIIHVGRWFSPRSGEHGGASLNNNGEVALAVHGAGGEERIALLTPTVTTREQAASRTSVNRLRQLGDALGRYWRDSSEVFPPMRSAAVARKALLPYVNHGGGFLQPETKQPYQPNPALSHVHLANIAEPWRTAAFYETCTAADGTRGVLFSDGHARRIPELEWRQLSRTLKLP
jgi:hypothetical protein